MPRRSIVGFALLQSVALLATADSFSGSSALEYTRHAVSFGERTSGSPQIAKLRAYIESQTRSHGWQVIEDSFTAETPVGPIAMKNLIAHLPGHTNQALVFTGHYDTKRMPGFLGANDAGSSTGFLLELARVLPSESRNNDIYLVWFDGEEAVQQWSDRDSVYGSRHLVAKWANDGTLARIKALINIDMIGDQDLDIIRDDNSSAGLATVVWQTAEGLGYGKYFRNDSSGIEDDHIPFRQAGVPAIDIIDLNYGPGNSYWHTPKDTMDRLSAHSLGVVGAVVMEVRRKLDQVVN